MDVPHITVSVVAEGAFEEEKTFVDESCFDEYISRLRDEADGHDYLIEVYALRHDHEIGIDCECVQYVADHHPAFIYNDPEVVS